MESKYNQNEEKFNEVSEKFSHISDHSFYSTLTKIAAQEYVNYLNENFKGFHDKVINTNSGDNSNGQTFAIKTSNGFVVNKKFVQKCIKQAHKKGLYKLFSFSKVNIVLDKLEETLANRK